MNDLYKNTFQNSKKLTQESLESTRTTSRPANTEFLIHILWRYKITILTMLISCISAGMIYLANATPIYTNVSRVYVEQTGPRIIQEISSGIMTGSTNYLYTQAELLSATPILVDAITRFDPSRMATFNNVDNYVSYLKQQIETSVGKKNDILQVAFKSPYPIEGAQIVNAVVDAYVTFHASSKKSTSLEVLKILKEQKETQSLELNDKQKDLIAFTKENEGIVYKTEQGNVIIERYARLTEAWTEAQLKVLELESIYQASMTLINDSNGLKQFVDAQRSRNQNVRPDVDLERLRLKLDLLQQQRTDRLRKLRVEHPAITVLDDEISKTEMQINQRDQTYAQAQLALMDQQYRAAKAREELLKKHSDMYHQEAVKLNRQLDQYAIMKADCEQTRKLCEILDDRIKELSMTDDVGALNITILEVAHVPDKPTAPKRTRIMALSLVLGLILGGGVAVIRDSINKKLCDVTRVVNLLHAPVFGTVPRILSKGSVVERGLVIAKEPNSNASEAYRTVRTSILFSLPHAQARVIQVTSAMPGEGKSTLVSNLGIAMAQSGERTLILDADLRKSVQHTIFELKSDYGITSVLSGLLPLREVLMQTMIPRLDVIPCGPLVQNPAELIGSARFRKILQQLLTRYDRIIVDSTPMIPVADGRILAALCDVTVVVVRLGSTQVQSLQETREVLVNMGVRITGCVINDVCQRRTEYRYYGYGIDSDKGLNRNTIENAKDGERASVNASQNLVTREKPNGIQKKVKLVSYG